jgi:hypothetical protein
MSISIFSSLSEDAKKDYHLNGTPQTIVVASNGKVLQNIEGAYVGENKYAAEKFFGIKFPGTSTEH